MKANAQTLLYCRCGKGKARRSGMCKLCYNLRLHDTKYFNGLREAVLKRDGYSCRVCGASGHGTRAIVVHHRVPGVSLLPLMIALCPACHAKVTRTKTVLAAMPPLLLLLWREQHPDGQEQTTLDFSVRETVVPAALLFAEDKETNL